MARSRTFALPGVGEDEREDAILLGPLQVVVGLEDLAQLRRRIGRGRLGLDAVALDEKLLRLDALALGLVRDGVPDAVELLGEGHLEVRADHQVHAAPQVEPQPQALVRQPQAALRCSSEARLESPAQASGSTSSTTEHPPAQAHDSSPLAFSSRRSTLLRSSFTRTRSPSGWRCRR